MTAQWTIGYSQQKKGDFAPSEISFSADVVGLGKTVFTDETQIELQAKLDFHHFYLTGEFGVVKTNSSGEGFDYHSDGTFVRIGPHVNFMPYNPHRASIFFGLMYASSSFSDQIHYEKTGAGWDDEIFDIKNNNLKSHWFEANIGMNVKVLGPLYLGYTLRFKFANTLTGYDDLKPLAIPGFGGADKGASFGFNYYIIYKLRFRDKPVPKRPAVVVRDKSTPPPKEGL